MSLGQDDGFTPDYKDKVYAKERKRNYERMLTLVSKGGVEMKTILKHLADSVDYFCPATMPKSKGSGFEELLAQMEGWNLYIQKQLIYFRDNPSSELIR